MWLIGLGGEARIYEVAVVPDPWPRRPATTVGTANTRPGQSGHVVWGVPVNTRSEQGVPFSRLTSTGHHAFPTTTLDLSL